MNLCKPLVQTVTPYDARIAIVISLHWQHITGRLHTTVSDVTTEQLPMSTLKSMCMFLGGRQCKGNDHYQGIYSLQFVNICLLCLVVYSVFYVIVLCCNSCSLGYCISWFWCLFIVLVWWCFILLYGVSVLVRCLFLFLYCFCIVFVCWACSFFFYCATLTEVFSVLLPQL